MQHLWHAAGPGEHFCSRCGVETTDDGPRPPGPCNPAPIAMCKHWSTTAKPFGVVVIAALPAAGFEGTRFEMNCCEACLLAIAHVVKEREKS